MKKTTLKYLIDTLLFIDISSIAILGLLLGLIIPKGNGAGHSAYFLGLHRHQWGDIHLYLSLFLLVLLSLHIWLNWAWIEASTKRFFGEYAKKFLWGVSAAWFVVLLLSWIVVKF